MRSSGTITTGCCLLVVILVADSFDGWRLHHPHRSLPCPWQTCQYPANQCQQEQDPYFLFENSGAFSQRSIICPPFYLCKSYIPHFGARLFGQQKQQQPVIWESQPLGGRSTCPGTFSQIHPHQQAKPRTLGGVCSRNCRQPACMTMQPSAVREEA